MQTHKTYSTIAVIALLFIQTSVKATSEPDLFLPQREELERARALWQSQPNTNYHFQYERIGTKDAPDTVYPWAITVTNDLASATDGNNNKISWTTPPKLDSFYQIIETQLNMGNVQQMDVQYNPQRGYPERIYLVLSPGGIYDVEVSNVVLESVRSSTLPPSANSKLDQLNKAKTLWRSKNVQNYSYQYRETTNAPQIAFPWSVTVRNTVDATGKDGNGNTINWANPHPYIMQELFDRIEVACQRNAPYIDVRYNTIYGYPEYILYLVTNDQVTDTFQASLYGFTV